MTAAELRVDRRRPVPTEVRKHPLAHRSGIELLGLILMAGEHWRPLSERQRDALRRAYLTAVASLRPEDEGTTIPPPLLPDGTHPATVRSLERRGLADAGRMTPLAVQVVQLADRSARKETP